LKHSNYTFTGYCADYRYRSLFIIQITSDVDLRSRSLSVSPSLPISLTYICTCRCTGCIRRTCKHIYV